MAVLTRTCYRATVTGQLTHMYSCASCGCVFRTLIERTVTDTAGAAAAARNQGTRHLVAELEAAPDVRPCPGCGLVPAAIIARRARFRHAGVWLLGGLATAAVAGLAAAGRIPLDTAAVAVPALALAGILFQVLTAAANPNRQRADNLKKAQADVAAGTTEVVYPGRPDAGPVPRAWTTRHTAGVLLAAAGPLALLVPAYVRAGLGGATNPDLSPSLISPGTTFTAPLPPPSFKSVNGWWSATATVDVLNAAQAHAPPTIPAFTRPSWGGGFSLTSDGTKSVPTDMHVAVTLPEDPALEGQTLHLRATLNVVYPTRIIKGSVDKAVTTVTHDFPVTIAVRAKDQAYKRSLLAGAAACLVGTLGGGLLLASGIRSMKRPPPPPEQPDRGENPPAS